MTENTTLLYAILGWVIGMGICLFFNTRLISQDIQAARCQCEQVVDFQIDSDVIFNDTPNAIEYVKFTSKDSPTSTVTDMTDLLKDPDQMPADIDFQITSDDSKPRWICGSCGTISQKLHTH